MSKWKKLYKSKRWRALRAAQLRRRPYCQCPHHVDLKEPATTVDHIEPHRGDRRLFFNPKNLQSLATVCHSRYKQSQEHGGRGFDSGSNADGTPLNQDAAWYQA